MGRSLPTRDIDSEYFCKPISIPLIENLGKDISFIPISSDVKKCGMMSHKKGNVAIILQHRI